MADRHPLVSVIVPVHGAAATLQLALDSIAASDYPRVELLVVDDGSRDASVSILTEAGIRVIRTEHAGPAAARNRAVAESSGDILFFTDADVEIAPDTITRGVAALEADPPAAAVFGSYTAEAGGDRSFFTRYKNYVHHFTHQRAREEAFTFWTGCGFVRREVFDRFDGFDGGQKFLSDVEFGTRMYLGGERIRVAKDIQVVHQKSYTLRGLLRSDFFGRAIPWSRILMRHKALRGDLNLGPANVASVPLSYLAVAGLILAIVHAAAWGWLALAAGGTLAALNGPLLAFMARAAGAWFAVRAFFMHTVIYLISGVGVVMAALGARSGGR